MNGGLIVPISSPTYNEEDITHFCITKNANVNFSL